MPIPFCLLLQAAPSRLILLSWVDMTIIAVYFAAVIAIIP